MQHEEVKKEEEAESINARERILQLENLTTEQRKTLELMEESA